MGTTTIQEVKQLYLLHKPNGLGFYLAHKGKVTRIVVTDLKLVNGKPEFTYVTAE